MFERFTERARETVVLAQEEARLHQHNYIGTEHLLLALFRGGDSTAATVLQNLGLELEEVRADMLAVVGPGTVSPSGHIPFTPRAKKVLELSLREALKYKDRYIGTEHILLGVMREGEGLACQLLVRRGLDLDRVREAVVAEMQRSGGDRDRKRGTTRQPAQTPAADDALAVARQLAAQGPVGSQHLLEALARSPESAAARVLAALGVDAEALAAKIDELGIEGTSDLTPHEAAARQMQVRLNPGGATATIVLADPETVGLVKALTERLDGPVAGDDPAVGSLAGLWQVINGELGALLRQLTPEPPAGDEIGVLAPVRQAIQARLRRRSRPRGGAPRAARPPVNPPGAGSA